MRLRVRSASIDRSARRVGDALGDRALARRDDAADGDDRGREERPAVRREREQEVRRASAAARRRVRVASALVGRDHGGDLAAHERAVALVEIDERVQIEVVGFARVPCEQPLGEVDAPVCGEIHRQERDVGADVGEAEAVGELDAVDDGGLVRPLQVDVLEAQVAVPVAHAPLGDASLEQRPRGREGTRVCQRTISAASPGDVCAHRRRGLGEVLLDVARDRERAPEARRLGGVGRDRRVKAREAPRDRVDRLGAELPLAQEDVRAAGVRQAPHVHGPVDDRPVTGEGRVAVEPRRTATTPR